jgi:hypothetical protein
MWQFKDWQIDEIKKVADMYRFPWEFLAAVIAVESAGKWEYGRVVNILPKDPFGPPLRTDRILPYVGLTGRELNLLGLGVDSIKNSHIDQVEALARLLAAARDRNNVWQNIASIHYRDLPQEYGLSQQVVRYMETFGYR